MRIDGGTSDGQTVMTKSIVAFLNFVFKFSLKIANYILLTMYNYRHFSRNRKAVRKSLCG
jgi:hypothetical protein